MAITFNTPPVASSHIAGVTDTIDRAVTYSPATSPKWIYCNYPEQLPAQALGDKSIGNRYLNRVYVYAGTTAEVFASYRNMSGYSVYFGVQLYNPKSTAVNVTVSKRGFHYNPGPQGQGWSWGVGQTPADFINYTGTTSIPIPGYGSKWALSQQGPVGNLNLFNCYVRFSTDGDVWCFPYVYNSLTNLDGSATLYSGTPAAQKRGLGSTCIINASVTYNVSDLPICFAGNSCQYNSASDMIELDDQGTIWDCSNTTLGNWGAHYLYNVTIVNNTASSKTINAHVGGRPGNPNLTPVIKYSTYPANWINLVSGQRWNWLTDTALAAGASRTYSYEYIQAANSNSPSLHAWTAS